MTGEKYVFSISDRRQVNRDISEACNGETADTISRKNNLVPFQDKCCRGNRRINIQNIQE